MSPQTLFAALLIAQATAEIIWTPSDTLSDVKERARRLEESRRLGYAFSHPANVNDTDCVVGGFNPVTTAVYVGGPCSGLDAALQPIPGMFRYVSMLTASADLADNNGPTGTITALIPDALTYPPLLQSQEITGSHSEVGTLGVFKFGFAPGQPGASARFFASQTSYLAQATIPPFNTVDFVTGQTNGVYDKINMCTESCGTPPAGGAAPCANNACPTAVTTAVAGEYKYSIMAAAFNHYEAIPTNQGWVDVENIYGTGPAGAKTLTGVFNVYQYVDFTEMQADNMTITAAGASTLYSGMNECSLLTFSTCTFYTVESIALAADNWVGLEYTFPSTYNRGEWVCNDQACKAPITSPSETKTVTIQAVKPDTAWKAILLLPNTAKVILLRYTFDVTGITANSTSGKWLVYDPSVRRAGAAAAAASSSSNSGSKSSTSDSVSRGCFAALLMAVWFMAAKM